MHLQYYITIGVSVGGLTSFDNDCKNNGKSKPWNNFDPKVIKFFLLMLIQYNNYL